MNNKIKSQIKAHLRFVNSFKFERDGFGVCYLKGKSKHTPTSMNMLCEFDLDKRVRNINKLFGVDID